MKDGCGRVTWSDYHMKNESMVKTSHYKSVTCKKMSYVENVTRQKLYFHL